MGGAAPRVGGGVLAEAANKGDRGPDGAGGAQTPPTGCPPTGIPLCSAGHPPTKPVETTAPPPVVTAVTALGDRRPLGGTGAAGRCGARGWVARSPVDGHPIGSFAQATTLQRGSARRGVQTFGWGNGGDQSVADADKFSPRFGGGSVGCRPRSPPGRAVWGIGGEQRISRLLSCGP